jgi:hypothetical protein
MNLDKCVVMKTSRKTGSAEKTTSNKYEGLGK